MMIELLPNVPRVTSQRSKVTFQEICRYVWCCVYYYIPEVLCIPSGLICCTYRRFGPDV